MAFDINWGILGRAPDPGAAFTQGVEQGRVRGQQVRRDQALADYAAAPSANALTALLGAGAVQEYGVLSKVEADRTALETRRQALKRGADLLRGGSSVLASPSAPIAPAPLPGVASPPSGVAQAPAGDIVVSATPPAPVPTMADVWELDDDTAKNLAAFVGTLDENGRKRLEAETSVRGSVAQALSQLPEARRQDALETQRENLVAAGLSQKEVDAFDLTDDGLGLQAAIAIGADKLLADHRAAEGQRITVRGQDVSASTARRGQDIGASTARRGQDIGAATALRGQDISAANKQRPSAATVTLAKNKLTALDALSNQLDRVERAIGKARYVGPVAGHIPGGVSGEDDAADTAVSGLGPLVRQLTRVPGEGAMSDYESRLAQAGLPSRAQTSAGRKEAIEQLRALVDQTRAGYRDILDQGKPAPSGFVVVRH